MLFFIAILIGGRGSILGPLLGTILLTLLPEFAAPLVAWSTFLYAALLLVIVLAIPGGIADAAGFRATAGRCRATAPSCRARRCCRVCSATAAPARRSRCAVSRWRFGGVRAIDGLDLEIRPGQVHGLIGPNGSGKTTTLNVICGYYSPEAGRIVLGPHDLAHGAPQTRAASAASPAPSRRRA